MGAIFKVPAMILYVLGGLWGLAVCLSIVSGKIGALGAIVAFFLLPITLYLAPWYAGFVEGNWFPVVLVYGSGLGAAVLMWIGSAIDGE